MEVDLYLGCPIWSYKGWVGSFYPQGTKPADYLREYARRLNTVEGNTTFYAVPKPATLEQWVKETPDTFRFCPKLARTISHSGELGDHHLEARQFIDSMSLLGDRLGPMFLQLPPRFSPRQFDDLRRFLEAWPHGVQLAVEVRHPDWFEPRHHENLNGLLSAHSMGRVVIDTRPIRSLQGDKLLAGSVYQRLLEARERKPHVPVLAERTTSFIFLRYIGHPKLEENAPFLDEWGEQLSTWLRDGTKAYVFCHCPDERLDPWLCREVHQRVAQSFPLSPLAWEDADLLKGKQARLF